MGGVVYGRGLHPRLPAPQTAPIGSTNPQLNGICPPPTMHVCYGRCELLRIHMSSR